MATKPVSVSTTEHLILFSIKVCCERANRPRDALARGLGRLQYWNQSTHIHLPRPTVTDVAVAAGVDLPCNSDSDTCTMRKGATWGDYDNDGHLDLFIKYTSQYGGKSKLFHSNG